MIELRNVSKRYGDNLILEDTSFVFPERGLVCLMGPSGGGKTTLLNLIAGFDSQYGGEIIIGGRAISGMSVDELASYRRNNVGFVFQNYHLLSGYSVVENVMLSADLYPDKSEDCHKHAESLLKQLGLSDKINQSSETLSGGQKQRVAIARALMGEPQIVLADEPTGALDRQTSSEIMELLKGISRERLVVVITHDDKILPYADEVIRIVDRAVVSDEKTAHESQNVPSLISKGDSKANPMKRAAKNFRVHLKRYFAVALAISVGLTAFLMSLSFDNVMRQSIEEFQEKNTVFNNGYIKGADDGTVLKLLEDDERIEHAYHQYILSNVNLTMGDVSETMQEKIPMPKTAESLSYGVMPRRGMNEIALSPSLAKKLAENIQSLLGRELILTLDGIDYPLTVSGIYNAGYDDFFVSSDVEQKFYADIGAKEVYSISYDVKSFEDVVGVSEWLKEQGITCQDASKEVSTLQNTFQSLQRLFLVISLLILLTALFLCSMLIVRLQNSRYRELGLLSALGYYRKEIRTMIQGENLMLAGASAIINAMILGAAGLVCWATDFPLALDVLQIFSCLVATFIVIMIIGELASFKLLRTEPAEALRK